MRRYNLTGRIAAFIIKNSYAIFYDQELSKKSINFLESCSPSNFFYKVLLYKKKQFVALCVQLYLSTKDVD